MEFRLTYTGPLLASQPADAFAAKGRRRDNKHLIRASIHRQLKRLWQITPFLQRGDSGGPTLIAQGSGHTSKQTVTDIAARYAMFGFHFVPLVTSSYDLHCALEILFLRPEAPGHVVKSGDIDNRVKTLLDALSIPDANEEYTKRTPLDDEKPLFVLLENDRLITKLSVETDRLLDDAADGTVSLVITARVRPYDPHIGNIQFA